MNDHTQIQAAMWLMIVIRTVNGVDRPGHGKRKLPAPKMYVAVIVLWSIFGLLVDAGQGRAAKAMAWVSVLTALVAGNAAAGKTLSNLLKTIATNFGTFTKQGGSPPPGSTTV